MTVGIYVHVPFCDRVCPYCDFAVVGGGVSPAVEERYVEALLAELSLRAADFAGRRLASVYLGGGTPSLLTPGSVERLVSAAAQAFSASSAGGAVSSGSAGSDVEVTLEVNPSTVERARLRGFRAAGVNRLSIGIQSFDDAVLRRLGRAHRADEGHQTLAAAREAGFENVSLDLIFAAPGQTLATLAADLDAVQRFGPEHVSCYELVVEAGTPFALADARGQLERADADEAADMVEAIDARLAATGLPRYELTNYARPGFESVHNQRYWHREPVLGIGVGAWSSDPPTESAPYGSRRVNPRKLADYLARGASGSGRRVVEVHDAATARGEAVFLGLRTATGLPAARFASWFGAPPRAFFDDAISKLVADGLLVEGAAGDLRLSPRGRMLSDLVSRCFI